MILGRCCAGCDEPGSLVCSQCTEKLKPRPRLRRSLDLSDISSGLRIPVACSLDYRGCVRHMLYRYKDHRIPQLAWVLSPALRSSIDFVCEYTGFAPHHIAIVILPTRGSTLRRRGFDSLATITHAALRGSGIDQITTPLRDIRATGNTKTLGTIDRQRLASGAFEVINTLPSKPTVIVDDIVTTGATAREAAATLMLAGVHIVALATVAGTP